MSTYQIQSSPPQTFTNQTPPQPQYYYFRGHKKCVSQLNKAKMLKTKRVKQKEQKVLRYDNEDEEFLQVEGEKYEEGRREETTRVNSQRRVKSQFQIMKLNPIDKLQRMQRIKRNNSSSTDHQQLMIRTSRMQITPQQPNRISNHLSTSKPLTSTTLKPNQQQQQPHITRFYSKNLQSRMNEYLNMVVAKSSQDHNEKVRKIREREEKVEGVKAYRETGAKIFMKSKFLRELKTRTNLNKKNHLLSMNNSNTNNHDSNTPVTARQQQQSSRTQSRQKPHYPNNFSHSRTNSYNNHSIHNHSGVPQNSKMIEGQQLINFASEVLSRSMKVYGSGKMARDREKSVRRINCSVQVVGNSK